MGKTASIEVRKLAEGDLSWVLPMDEGSFPLAWKKGTFLEELSGRLAHYYGLFEGSTPFAYGGFWLVAGEAQIMRLAVDPGRRGEKKGLFLVASLIEKARELGAKEVTLEVREHNLPARKTYEHLGFLSCGKRPHYYADSGEDAVFMRLLLTNM